MDTQDQNKLQSDFQVQSNLKLEQFQGTQEFCIQSDFPVVNLLKLTEQNFASTYSNTGKIDIWQLGQLNPLRTIYNGDGKDIWTLELLENDIFAVGAATLDFSIKLYNWQNGQLIKSLYGHQSGIYFINKFYDNKMLSGGHDKTIICWQWNKEQAKIKCIDNAHTDRITACQVLNKERFITGSNDRNLKLWDSINWQCIFSEKTKSDLKSIIQISQEQIAVSCKDGTIILYSIDNNKILLQQLINAHQQVVYNLLLINEKQIASASWDKNDKYLKLWDITNYNLIKKIPVNGEVGRGIILMENSKIIVGSTNSNEITILK